MMNLLEKLEKGREETKKLLAEREKIKEKVSQPENLKILEDIIREEGAEVVIAYLLAKEVPLIANEIIETKKLEVK